jgi:outer membrane protein OmpA-like peptidoglycan-associated protein
MAAMHPYRRYDRLILNCARRAKTVQQIERAMHRASLTDFSAEDIQVRCEVLRQAGRLRIRPGGRGRPAYELCGRESHSRLTAPTSSHGSLRATLIAGAVVSAMGCSTLGSGSAPLFPEDLPKYHTERVPNLSRVYQVPGQVVYRLCPTTECAAPTPKVRTKTVPPETVPESAKIAAPALAQASPLPQLAAPTKQAAEPATPEPASRAAIFFGFGSAKLGADSLETLKSQAGVIKEAKRIVLVGRTDHVGTIERNRLFAQKRADAIRDALVALGVPKESISVEIDPKTTEPLHPGAVSASKPADKAAQARRVDVLIH